MRWTHALAFVSLVACGSSSGDGPGDAGILDAPPSGDVDAGILDAPPSGDVDAGPPRELVTFPARPRRNLDLLLVDDNSSSMTAKQATLAKNVPRLIDALRSLDGGLPSLHIGVVSTDVGAGAPGDSICKGAGDDGKLLVRATCAPALTPGATFIALDGEGAGAATNLTGGAASLDTTFACMAQLGDKGCGFEQPLESMKRALSPGSNPGFLRADAFLAVLVLSDEDDCSARVPDELFATATDDLGPRVSFRCFEYGVTCDEAGRGFGPRNHCTAEASERYLFGPDRYAQFVKDLKGAGTADDADILVAGILGDVAPVAVQADPDNASRAQLAPSCSTARSGGSAAPAIRIQRFLSQFPGRSRQASICSDDFSSTMSIIGATLRDALGNPCIAGELIDGDPSTPAVEPRCTVADVVDPRGDRRETPIPSCAESQGAMPCWQIAADARRCAETTSHLRLAVQRVGEAAAGVQVEGRCAVR